MLRAAVGRETPRRRPILLAARVFSYVVPTSLGIPFLDLVPFELSISLSNGYVASLLVGDFRRLLSGGLRGTSLVIFVLLFIDWRLLPIVAGFGSGNPEWVLLLLEREALHGLLFEGGVERRVIRSHLHS